MNQLSTSKRIDIVQHFVEGCSMRSITRITGCSINTVSKLLVDLGRACSEYHKANVYALLPERIEIDEIWSYVGAKDKVAKELGKGGSVWTWISMDAKTRLVINWFSGTREMASGFIFMSELARIVYSDDFQLTTDGYAAYEDLVKICFHDRQVNYAQLVKEVDHKNHTVNISKRVVMGNPDPNYISTSYIERQNGTIRTNVKRFVRKTNAFSKKLDNHCYALAIHFVHHNFCRVLAKKKYTPAQYTSLTAHRLTVADMVGFLD